LTTVNSKLNFLFGSAGEGSLVSEPSSRENFYPLKLPTELYLALIDRMSKTRLSKGDCLIDMLTETAYREGLLPEEHYKFLKLKYGTKTVLDKVLEGREKREEASVKVEVSAAKYETKLEVQKSTVQVAKPKKRPDYSAMSLDELQRRLEHLREIGDVSEVQFVAYEIKKRLAQKGVLNE